MFCGRVAWRITFSKEDARLMSNLKSHAIYGALRERILSNDIAPGTRLVMRDVANHYEASDIPVREALRMLERDGLVETAPYRGARVTTLTAKEVAETYFIRSHLESIATGLAAERITDAEMAQLDRLMSQMRSAVDAQDGPRFSDLNLEFHRTIVASCGNDMLRELTMDIWQRHSGFQRVFRMVPERLATSQREHEGIMAALRDHDAERASRLALLHKQSVRDSVSTLIDQVDERGSDQVGDGARPAARDRAPAAP
jgi:DNA-binding GntR family transcriptional regulator